MRYFLGCHQPGWLSFVGLPLFVSRRRLERYRQLPRAAASWALDSGGFTELRLYGGWQLSPVAYVTQVRRYQQEIGQMLFAAPQDWMCEPVMLRKSGLSVSQHQQRTVDNYLTLLDLAPDVPWLPVVQGWTPGDYMRCVGMYLAAGVDLAAAALVGVGSVCRRQSSRAIGEVVAALRLCGVRRLHGFGVKTIGLRQLPDAFASADSMAWSFDARRSLALPECAGQHRNCANCWRWARQWYDRLVSAHRARLAAQAPGPLLIGY